MSTQPMNQGYVKFQLNVPETLTLASIDPKPCRDFHQNLQHMYRITDGRVIFVPPAVSQYFHDKGVRPGQSITITKQRAQDGRNIAWTVVPSDTTFPVSTSWNGTASARLLEKTSLDGFSDATTPKDSSGNRGLR